MKQIKKLLVGLIIWCSGALVGGTYNDINDMNVVTEIEKILDDISTDTLSGDEKKSIDLYNDIIINMISGHVNNNVKIISDSSYLLKEYYDGHFLYSHGMLDGVEVGYVQGQISIVEKISKEEEKTYLGIQHPAETVKVDYYPMDELAVIMAEDCNYIIYGFDGSDVIKAGTMDLLSNSTITSDIAKFAVVPVRDYLLGIKNDSISEKEQTVLEDNATYGVVVVDEVCFSSNYGENTKEEENKHTQVDSVVNAGCKVYTK